MYLHHVSQDEGGNAFYITQVKREMHLMNFAHEKWNLIIHSYIATDTWYSYTIPGDKQGMQIL